jgi:hypothetical protein
LAVELKSARDECGDNDTAFGCWLVDNDCDDLGRHDRAALIKFGEHLELARRVLQETRSNSVRLIWQDEVKPRLACDNVVTGSAVPEPAENPQETPSTALPAGTTTSLVSISSVDDDTTIREMAVCVKVFQGGTTDFAGPLWQVRRVPPDGLLVELDRFVDYLLEPPRKGLGMPSLHFLRQTLNALPNGPEALQMVSEQLTSEGVDFKRLADRDRDAPLLDRRLNPNGVNVRDTNIVPLSLGGNDRKAAQLAARRPDLANKVRAGDLTLTHALVEAGIIKRETPLQTLRRGWRKASAEERAAFLAEI